MNQRRGATVLITGASKGIGEAAALHLAEQGFRVFAGVRAEADATALRTKGPERLTPVPLDVTDAASIAAAVRTLEERSPAGLHGLVNNAGIVMAAPLEFLPLEQFRRQLEVNVVGVLAVTQAALPLLRVGQGRIVNVSSINGRMATPFAGAYAASKFALEALSDALRMELRRWHIGVSVIQPGAVQTPIWATSTTRALAIAQAMPPRAKELYGGIFRMMAERAGEPPKRAIPPLRVARTIARALTARRPKTRYLVGNDARLGALLVALLPDRVRDRILTGR